MKAETRRSIAYGAAITTGLAIGTVVSIASAGLIKTVISGHENIVMGYIAGSIVHKALGLIIGLPIIAVASKALGEWVDNDSREESNMA